MAEDEKTPETTETTEETAPEAVATDAAPAETPAEAAPPAPAAATRRERLEARRAERRPAPRGPVTAEQREEERQARRDATAKQRRAYRGKLKERRAAAPPKETPEAISAPEHGPGRPKVRSGVVSSAKGDKTITVLIDVTKRHRRYHKIMRSTQKLYAHDEANTAGEGDTVRIVECRPMSRTKRWRLTEVLERAK